MRMLTLAALALLAGGCASGGSRFPVLAIDPQVAISQAQEQLNEAQQAGAAEFAPEALATAQRRLGEADAYSRQGQRDRAAVTAQSAMLDAQYARALARRVQAERSAQEARAALDQLPPGGAR